MIVGWLDGENWMNGNVLERNRNLNRGFRKLDVWMIAIELYVIISKNAYSIKGKPYKVINQLIGSAYSIPVNIAEGYSRRSINEYLYHLNVALSSLGELGSGLQACYSASQLDDSTFKQIDILHYEVENKLLKLVESL